MITAVRKPMEEIIAYVEPFKRIFLVGCNECVTVCAAGGRKEVWYLSSALQMAFLKKGRSLEVIEHTLERQCDPEYVDELVPMIDRVDAVVSMACGCGVQEVARRFKEKPVFPAVNTEFMGASERQGVWAERCQGCGDCLLGITGGICPVARCSKTIAQWPLRRVVRRQVRNQPGRGLRLAAHLGQADRSEHVKTATKKSSKPKTGEPAGTAVPARS